MNAGCHWSFQRCASAFGIDVKLVILELTLLLVDNLELKANFLLVQYTQVL